MLDRRKLLAGAAATAALPLIPARALAEAHTGGATATLVDAQRFPVGELTFTALSDGSIRIGADALSGIDQQGYDAAMERQFRDPAQFHAAVNAFLIQRGDEVILIDTGSGATMGEGLGRMLGNLEGAGVSPGDVTLILATHLHPDHVGGAVADGQAVFPNAELAVSETERAYWSDDANASEGSRQFFDVAQGVLSAYGDRLKPFDGETEVASGITALPLPGHTPGHTGYAVTSGDASVLMWADIVHVAPVQLAQPDVTIGFDVDPRQAAETRARILDRVVADRMRIASSHIDFPGLGHVGRGAGDEGAYRFVASAYPYAS